MKIKGKRVLKNGVIGAYVYFSKEKKWKWRFIGNIKKKGGYIKTKSSKYLDNKKIQKCKKLNGKIENVTGEKFIFKIKINNKTYFLKIFPIWNKSWDNKYFKGLINQYQTLKQYNFKVSWGQYIISSYLSKLKDKMVSFNFIDINSICKTKNLNKYLNIEKNGLENDLKNIGINTKKQEYIISINPAYHEPFVQNIADKYFDDFRLQAHHIVFQCCWALFVSYELFKFVHGDILQGRNHNILCNKIKCNKKYVIYKYKGNIWRFKLKNNIFPYIILFDYGFSNFNYDSFNIKTRVPLSQPLISSNNPENYEIKRKYDIDGLNHVLYNIEYLNLNKNGDLNNITSKGKAIKQVKLKNNKNLILQKIFDKFKNPKNLDKSECLIFDFDNFER